MTLLESVNPKPNASKKNRFDKITVVWKCKGGCRKIENTFMVELTWNKQTKWAIYSLNGKTSTLFVFMLIQELVSQKFYQVILL